MKKKAMLVVLVAVMGLAVLSIGTVEAAWYTCSISQAGAANNGYYIVTLTDNGAAFTNNTFVLSATNSMQKSMLACALTAFANSTNVYVNTVGIAPGATVTHVYASK